MTDKQKDLVWLMLQPHHYMVETSNNNGTRIYKVYTGKQDPVQYFSPRSVKKILNFFKVDVKNKMTLNLTMVRQMNGNTFIKKLYKERRMQDGK